MATSQYSELPTRTIALERPYAWSWSGIFCGTFVFLAIESTFGLLGQAIFAPPSMGFGLKIWMTVLSIIALYFAGRTASKMLHRGTNTDLNLGLYHGLVTFGMAIFATVLIFAIASTGQAIVSNSAALVPATHPFSIGGFLQSSGEWWIFVAFILSMASAMMGGMHGVRKAPPASAERTTTTMRAA